MLKTLVKTYFKGNGGLSILQALKTGNSKSKKKSKGRSILSYFGLIYLSILYMWSIYSNFVSQLKTDVLFAVISSQSVALMLTIFFTLTSVDNILVTGSDINTLKTLPIDTKTLTLSRFVILYFEVFCECLLAIIPFAVAALINIKFNIVFYLLLILDALIIPAFSAFFMGVFSYLSAKSKVMKRAKTVLIYVLSFFVIYFMLRVLGNQAGPNSSVTFALSERVVVSNQVIILFAAILGALALCSIILYFVCLKLSKIVIESENIKEKDKQLRGEISYKQNSIFKALVIREKRIMFSNSSFSTELVLELVMPLFILLIYAVMGILGDMSKDIMSIPGIENYLYVALWGVIMMFYTFNLLSSTSVSREGKDFDLCKIYPINVKDRVNSKLVFHLIATLPFIEIFIIAIAIGAKAPALETILIAISMVPYIASISVIGLTIDFNNPHTAWERPQEAVKQNTNGLGAMGISIIELILIVGLFILSEIYLKIRLVSTSMPLIISLIFFVIFYKTAINNAKKQFEQ